MKRPADRRASSGANAGDIIGALCIIGFVLLALTVGLVVGK